MASFSATDAAFEGFRLTREQPRMVLFWALALLALNIVTALLLVSLVGGEWEEIQAALQTRDPSPEESVAMFRRLLPIYAVTLPLSLLTAAVLQAAVCRAVFGEPGGRRGWLRLGADELRVLATQTALAALFFLVLVVGAVLVGLLAAAAGGGLAGFLLFMGLVALLLWLSVRLSLAPAQTFAERRIRVFGSWRLTRRQGWKLFGTYVLALALAVTVSLLALAIYAALMTVIGGGVAAAGAMFRPDYSSLAAYFTPGVILGQVVGALISALFNALMLAPGAVAYRSLAAEAA